MLYSIMRKLFIPSYSSYSNIITSKRDILSADITSINAYCLSSVPIGQRFQIKTFCCQSCCFDIFILVATLLSFQSTYCIQLKSFLYYNDRIGLHSRLRQEAKHTELFHQPAYFSWSRFRMIRPSTMFQPTLLREKRMKHDCCKIYFALTQPLRFAEKLGSSDISFLFPYWFVFACKRYWHLRWFDSTGRRDSIFILFSPTIPVP